MKITEMKRHIIQAAAALLTNLNIKGFFTGSIYKGASKQACVPGLNCYSCPGAVGACPIGSLQAELGKGKLRFPAYVTGILLFFGVIFGRLICGFFCLFGFIQDLLYKIPVPKLVIPKKIDKPLRYVKYAILLIFVIILPLFLRDEYGTSAPYFCKLICPAGTLEGGIPLVLLNTGLRSVIGFLFRWKISILVIIVALSIFIYRPFCKYICPLGAIYSLFNRFSFYQMHLDKSRCIGCKQCERQCKMGVEITKNINSTECIRCGACINACKKGAISSGFNLQRSKTETKNASAT